MDWLQHNQHSTHQSLTDLGDLGIFQMKEKEPWHSCQTVLENGIGLWSPMSPNANKKVPYNLESVKKEGCIVGCISRIWTMCKDGSIVLNKCFNWLISNGDSTCLWGDF